jgi:hypothetical protein
MILPPLVFPARALARSINVKVRFKLKLNNEIMFIVQGIGAELRISEEVVECSTTMLPPLANMPLVDRMESGLTLWARVKKKKHRTNFFIYMFILLSSLSETLREPMCALSYVFRLGI